MQSPQLDAPVRLKQDIPELDLRCGDLGIVCSTWFAPQTAYEVEFPPHDGLGHPLRVLLLAHQLCGQAE